MLAEIPNSTEMTLHSDDDQAEPGDEIPLLPGPKKGDAKGSQQQELNKMVYLNHAPPVAPFSGKQNEDWPKFKQRILNLFRITEQDDTMAAAHFSTYLEGNAYNFWASLSEQTQNNIHRLLRAFDKKYADELQQGYWQMAYENLTYLGPEKETLDDLAVKIQHVVNKAFPDYIKPDNTIVHRGETRRMYARKKFWDLQPPEIKEAIFIKFGTSDASLKQQLEYARVIQADKMRSRKEEMSYETVCVAQKVDHSPSQEYLNKISSVIKQQSKQIEDLTKEVQRKDNYNYNPNRQRDAGPKLQLQRQPKQQSQSQVQLQQNPQPQQQQGQRQGNRNWNRNSNQEFRPRSQSQDSRQGPVRECFYCGQAGHIRRFCQKIPE